MDNHTLTEVIDLAVKTAVLQVKKEAILECRPIGSYFLTETEDDPNILFGGGWQKMTGRYVLQCSDDSHKAGTTVEAGLPNITGEATFVQTDGSNQTQHPDLGCFSWGSSYNYSWKVRVIDDGSAKRDLLFSASRSNSIYGNSDTVQPPARIVNVWKRVS